MATFRLRPALRASAMVVLLLVGACSLLNREGPDASCADLQNGAANACTDGIIATCANGIVLYKVCDQKSACSAPWQTSGRYRCTETEPAPELVASPPDGGGSKPVSDGGASVDATNGSDGSSTTCSPPADETCGTGLGHRYCTDSRTWSDCLAEDPNCIEHKSGGWPSLANASGGACGGKPSGAVVACKACAGSVVCGATSHCAIAPGSTATACGKPGTVVRELGTAGGETYCLQGGAFMGRGTASGTPITSGEINICPTTSKPADDVEPCSGAPGSAEVCQSCNGITWVRVCRTTGKWSGCNRGSL